MEFLLSWRSSERDDGRENWRQKWVNLGHWIRMCFNTYLFYNNLIKMKFKRVVIFKLYLSKKKDAIHSNSTN